MISNATHQEHTRHAEKKFITSINANSCNYRYGSGTIIHNHKINTSAKLDRQTGKHRIIDPTHNQCKYHKYISYQRIGSIMGTDFGLNAPVYSKMKISYTLSKISYMKMLPPFIGQYAASQGTYTKQ